MASGPITSWQIDGKTVETVSDFIFWGSKINADGDCSDEIKRCLLLGRKVMTNLDSILKSRDITLSTKVSLVKTMVFPVAMYGCESWSIKKAEHQRIDAFELWCWRRLLRVRWTVRTSNQSILKEINPGCSLKDWCWSWNSNTLVTSCEELIHWKRPWCWEGLGVGGEGHDRRWDSWMASPARWTWVWVNSRSWWWTGSPGMLEFMGLQRVGHDWVTELNWTELMVVFCALTLSFCVGWSSSYNIILVRHKTFVLDGYVLFLLYTAFPHMAIFLRTQGRQCWSQGMCLWQLHALCCRLAGWSPSQ